MLCKLPAVGRGVGPGQRSQERMGSWHHPVNVSGVKSSMLEYFFGGEILDDILNSSEKGFI